MRGEVVGMTPRRSRSSTALTHALVVVSEIQFRSIIKRSAYNVLSTSIINRRYIDTHISHAMSCIYLNRAYDKIPLIYLDNLFFTLYKND